MAAPDPLEDTPVQTSPFHGLIGPLYTIYAIRELHLTPVLYGIAIAMGGVANLAGALSAPLIVRRFGMGTTFLGSALIYGAAALLIPAAHGPVPLAMACLIGAQLFGDSAWLIYVIPETPASSAH